MGEGFRYKIQHMGDIFVDGLEGALGWTMSSTKGITLTYDIHDLEKRKNKALRKIGARISEIRRGAPDMEVFSDEKIMELFSKLDGIEEKIEAQRRERDERLEVPCQPVEGFESG